MFKIPTALASCFLLVVLSLLAAGQATAAAPSTAYTVKPVCAAPPPGHAACLGLRVRPNASVSPAPAPAAVPGLVLPSELHTAYALPTDAAEAQTIALVDAYDDPNVEADLGEYDQKLGLPVCTHADGCFTKVNQEGQSTPLPAESGEWSEEIATDVETAHALCENCHIVLVEASTDAFANLEAAENTAAALPPSITSGPPTGEISNSWGGEEPEAGTPDSSAFNHPGIVITTAAGDAGYLNWDDYRTREQKESPYFEGADYPASSPHVIAVGGTKLSVNRAGEWASEEVWNASEGAGHAGAGGGGCSRRFAAPVWQTHAAGWGAVGCGQMRAVADVAADADPGTGVPVYDSVPVEEEEGGPKQAPGWIEIGGTSVASPIVASAFALAGGAHGIRYPAATLYANAGTAGLHDITVGGNGECDDLYSGSCSGSLSSPLDCGAGNTICNAAPGYDGPTGVGTPDGLSAFLPVPGQIEEPAEGNPAAGSGGGSGTASPGGATSTSTNNPTPPPSKASSRTVLTRLSLTLSAVIALNRTHPGLSKLAFTFAISTAADVRVTLARRTRVHGHWLWKALPGANTIAAHAGTNQTHLSGRGALPSGLYRLTLTPTGGVARSLSITIG